MDMQLTVNKRKIGSSPIILKWTLAYANGMGKRVDKVNIKGILM